MNGRDFLRVARTPTELVSITDAMKLYEQGIGDITWRP